MSRKFFLSILLAGTIISCTQVYKEWEKESFSTLSWKPGQEIKFYPVIEDTTLTYELTLGVRNLYGSSLERLNLIIISISPSGAKQTENYTLTLMDENGKSLASCAGNMCDLESVVNQNLTFSEPGKYTFVVTPFPEGGRITGIMEFGFILDEK